MSELEDVLAAHWEIDAPNGYYTCDCGRVLGENGVTPSGEIDPRHRSHVATVIRAWLLSEATLRAQAEDERLARFEAALEEDR